MPANFIRHRFLFFFKGSGKKLGVFFLALLLLHFHLCCTLRHWCTSRHLTVGPNTPGFRELAGQRRGQVTPLTCQCQMKVSTPHQCCLTYVASTYQPAALAVCSVLTNQCDDAIVETILSVCDGCGVEGGLVYVASSSPLSCLSIMVASVWPLEQAAGQTGCSHVEMSGCDQITFRFISSRLPNFNGREVHLNRKIIK